MITIIIVSSSSIVMTNFDFGQKVRIWNTSGQ